VLAAVRAKSHVSIAKRSRVISGSRAVRCKKRSLQRSASPGSRIGRRGGVRCPARSTMGIPALGLFSAEPRYSPAVSADARTRSQTIGLAPGAATEAAGQDARKYGSTNPVVARLLEHWIGCLRQAVAGSGDVVLDVGIGEGFAFERLGLDPPLPVGVEYRLDKLESARTRVARLAAVRADAGMLPLPDASIDLVLCTEVLEHLVRPEPALTELARVTRGVCVVSVPWEPWFRVGNLVRGKNVRRLGNDPEHVQQFGPTTLRRRLEAPFRMVEVRRCFPWLVAVCRLPRR
jgi:SAM-dependent methyltransferase